MKIIGEIIAYALFAAVVGLLSAWPTLQVVGEQQAIVSLSLIHAGNIVGECRTLTQEELDALPPNMRKPTECPRERFPVRVELRFDGQILYQETAAPTGIWSDGKSNMYRRVIVEAGKHELFIGMNDSGGEGGFDYQATHVIDITPGRSVAIQFDELERQFRIQ